jgi:hypothetical protein
MDLPTHDQHLPYAMPSIPELQTALPALHALNQGGGPLTMNILLATWDECWANLQAGRLSVNEVEAKLDLACIDRRYQDLLVEAWRNCRTWDRIQAGLPTAPIVVATYTAYHQQDPHLFAPATRGLELYAITPVARSPNAPTDGDHQDHGGYSLRMG